jgi:polyphosphate glucokinase
VSIGYPGPVVHDRPLHDPRNLGPGWVGFDFRQAFGCPVKLINDAAMQALGSYQGGRLLFLGLGTGLGSAMIVDGLLAPMELAHLPYKNGRTYEDYVGLRGLKRLGKKRWRRQRDRRRGAAPGGPRARRRGHRRGQRQEARGAAAGLPAGR